MSTASLMVVLFSVATAVAIATRRLPIPYTVALLMAGLGLGAFHALDVPHMNKEVLFAVFLPGLLFEAAFHIEFRDFRRNSFTIAALALPGVVAAIGLTAVIVTAAFRVFGIHDSFLLRHGLVLGALLAATDPIAVISLFRAFKVPPRLQLLVEGESLFNDGTSIVFFALILEYVSGNVVTIGSMVSGFLLIAGGGIVIGSAFGLAASLITKKVDDAMIEITITVVAAYGSFALADSLGVSGVMATVAAGMICGNYGQRFGMSPATKAAVTTFWEYVAFALNSLVFLLMGFEVIPLVRFTPWMEMSIAYLAVTIARFGIIFTVVALLSRTEEKVPRKWAWPLGWGGLRGALSMVLALSLPRDFPERNILILMTFGVVVISILLQGLTITTMLRRLGINRSDNAQPA
jgi:CPA1 family monovalent cation:H+ antiporter